MGFVTFHLSLAWMSASVPALPAEEAPSLHRAAPTAEGDVAAVAMEIGGLLGAGTVWYTLAAPTHAPDWKYDLSWESAQRKLFTGEAVGFDDNALYLNLPGHALAGTTYYLAGRANGFGSAASLGVASLASLTWELASEYREILSLNDLLVTPVGGLIVGESLFQIAEVFGRSEDRLLFRALHRLFLGPSSLYSWRRPFPGPDRLDGRGLATSLWHRFRLSTGGGWVRIVPTGPRVGAFELAAKSQVLRRDRYLATSEQLEWVTGPLNTQLDVAAAFAPHGLAWFELYSHLVYAGAYGQQLIARGGRAWGWGGYVGLSALYDHREQWVDLSLDLLAMTSPVGPRGFVAMRWGEVSLELSVEVHPVFGAVHPVGLVDNAMLDGPGTPPVLKRSGYYWAYGLRSAGSIGLYFRGAELKWTLASYQLAHAEEAWLGSGYLGPHLGDQRVLRQLSIAFPIHSHGFGAGLALHRATRAGRMESVEKRVDDSSARLFVAWTI